MRWYWGLAVLAVGAGTGAALGAVASTPCPDGEDLFCGPRWGAAGGATVGLLLVGIAGLGAALSKDYRAPGLVAAGATAAIVTGAAIKAKG